MGLISGQTKNIKTGIVHASHSNRKPLCYSLENAIKRAKNLRHDDLNVNGVTCKNCLRMNDVKWSYAFQEMHRTILNKAIGR